VQSPPEAWRRSRNFFLGYFVSISFPVEFDVWDRFNSTRRHVSGLNHLKVMITII